MKKFTVLSVCIVLVFGLSFATSAMASDEEDILQVVENWSTAMNTADIELMSSTYWHSSKTTDFAPNKAGAFLVQGWDALGKMWKGYLGMPKGTFTNTHSNIQVTMLTNDVAVVTCYQTLIVNPPAAKEQTTNLMRNTRVVQKIGGKWLIVHDHASVLPTE